MSDWYTFADKPRTALKLEIKKFNRKEQLCYYDSVDLTCRDVSEDVLEIFSQLFVSAGFKVEIKTHTYFGIYDPSRMAELIELYPTDEELIRREFIK
jgi:hypothetical protein